MSINPFGEQPKQTVIAMAQQKGGVGKTTTVICLGGALVELGFKVLLVDLDAQGGLTETLGRKPDTMHHTAVDLLLGYTLAKEVITPTNLPGLDLIPSHSEVGLMERVLPNRRGYPYSLRRSLERYSQYDYILLDCAPFLGTVTTNALVAANMVILPSVPEYLPVFALHKVLQLIKSIKEAYNEHLVYRILLTMVDSRNRVHIDLSQQMRSYFNNRIFSSIIQTDTRLREIILAGLPITHYAPKTRSATEYRKLAMEISGNGRKKAPN